MHDLSYPPVFADGVFFACLSGEVNGRASIGLTTGIGLKVSVNEGGFLGKGAGIQQNVVATAGAIPL